MQLIGEHEQRDLLARRQWLAEIEHLATRILLIGWSGVDQVQENDVDRADGPLVRLGSFEMGIMRWVAESSVWP